LRTRVPFWVLPLAIAALPRALLLPDALREEPFGKYVWAAGEIAGGRSLGNRLLDFSPLYLGVHVVARRAAADPAPLLIVAQSLLGVAATLLVYGAGRALAGRAAGLIAAALYSGYATLLAYEVTLEPEAVVLFLVAALLYLGEVARGRGAALLLGLALGLGVAARPNLVLAAPIALVPLLAPHAERARWAIGRGARLGALAVGLAIGALPLAGALARGGGGLLDAMSSGQVFHQGLNPEARGIGVAYPSFLSEMPSLFTRGGDYAHEMYREVAAADLGRLVGAREADGVWRERALAFARLYPGAALRLEARKAVLFASGVEAHDVPETVVVAERASRIAPIRFAALAPLGFAGALLALRRPRKHALPLLVLGLYMVSALTLFVTSRQRLPAAAPLAILGAAAVVGFAGAARARRAATALAIAAAALAFALVPLAATPVARGYRAQFEALRRAEALLREARAAYDEARVAEYRAAAFEAALFSPEALATLPALGLAGAAPDAARDPARVESAVAAACPSARRDERAFLVGAYLLAAGDAEGASERLRGLARNAWFGAPAAHLRALALARLAREPEALDALAACEPPTAAGGALRAVLLDRAGRAPDAARERDRLVACHGATATAYWTGRANHELGDWSAARAAFEQVRDRLPQCARARLYLAKCALRLGDDATAAAEHAAALAADPDAHLSSLTISGALARLAAASPDDRALRARLGAALLDEGDPAEATRALAPLLAEDPTDDSVRLDLARALAEQGKTAEARAIAAPLAGAR